LKHPKSFIENKLLERQSSGSYRKLGTDSKLIDFCSNDYLGFARSLQLKNKVDEELNSLSIISNGSTGSRLLSGNSAYAEELEGYLANVHGCEAALIFNSGFSANLSLFSALPQKGDTIIIDELIHASIIDGARLGFAECYKFRHNDLASLEAKLKMAKGICYVAVESVYSMDGDSPDFTELLQITEKYNAHLIVDEAHAVGLYGLGLIDNQLQSRIFARTVTFGKALGCHGAAVLGSNLLKQYLINFARPFIYTTAPPFHQLASIKMAYQLLLISSDVIKCLKNNIDLFKLTIEPGNTPQIISSCSAIQSIVLKGNEMAKNTASLLQGAGFDVRAILSPTVPKGSERIRICLHSFNSENEIHLLTEMINKLVNAQ
jgi:8-amino-7-oxononanoate synthase